MGWLSRIFGGGFDEARGNYGAGDDHWFEPAGPMVAAGVAVTRQNALKVPAVLNCLSVLAEPLASLPLVLFRRDAAGNKQRLDNHPIATLLQKRPNDEQTAYEFRGQMMFDLALENNAYAEILPGPSGAVDQLIRLDPQRVRVERLPTGERRWQYTDPVQGRQRFLTEGEIWHLKGLPLTADGLCGQPQIDSARETIGAAIAVQLYAARFFANGTKSGGVIEHPSQFKDKDSRNSFMGAWRRARSGQNAHRDAVLEFGMKYVKDTQTNDEAQFIETRKELALEIARIWNVPPHKIGILDRATFSNIEQQALEFVTDTLLPWLVLWEQAISRDLIIADGTFFAEFNVAGLLRGDLKTRYEAYAVARNWGWLSVNDIRRLENMNKIADGDVYLRPLNMVPAGDPADPSSMGRGRASNDPGPYKQINGVWMPSDFEASPAKPPLTNGHDPNHDWSDHVR